MPVSISAIIVNWNTRDLLLTCLQTLLADAGDLQLELIVVDNDSHDGSVAAVQRRFPTVQVMETGRNLGFAAANNIGIGAATGRWILLLNPDTEVRPGLLAALAAFLTAVPRAGAVGPLVVNPDGTLQTSCYPLPTPGRELWRLLHLDRLRPVGTYDMTRWPQDRPRRVEVLQGVCMLLRREALDDVGLLDDAYFMYTEEVDLCLRLQRAGWELHWEPRGALVHFGGQSTRQARTAMFIQLYRSKIQFFRKHYGPGTARLYKGVLLLTALPRLFLLAAGRPNLRLVGQHYALLVRSLPSL